MISDRELRRWATKTVLDRAAGVARARAKLYDLKCSYAGADTRLSAHVKASDGWAAAYLTEVTIDEEAGTIQSCSCTCPAFSEYQGPCKHCMGLVMKFNASPVLFRGYAPEHNLTTSPCLGELMRHYAAPEETAQRETVKLDLFLTSSGGEFTARFKVEGNHGSYVLKSISAFVARMHEKAYYSYGKKLAFVHEPAQLTEHARSVFRFLERACNVRATVTSYSSYRYYYPYEAVGRDLTLSSSECIELLDLFADVPFTFTDEFTQMASKAKPVRARIVEQDPPLGVRIEKVSDEGYELVREDDAAFVRCGDRLYAWKDDTFYRCSEAFVADAAKFLYDVYLTDQRRLFISSEDLPLFCATVLPRIEGALRVHAQKDIEAYRPVPCTLEFYLDRTEQGVLCDARAVYDETSFPIFGTLLDEALTFARDKLTEQRAQALVERYFTRAEDMEDAGGAASAESALPRIADCDDDALAHLVFAGLAEMRALGAVFSTPSFDRLMRESKPRVTVGLSINARLLDVSVLADGMPADEVGSILASYRRKRSYHRLKDGSFVSLAGMGLEQLDDVAAELGLTKGDIDSGRVELPAYQAFRIDALVDDDTAKDESFKRYLDGFRSIDPDAYRVPSSLAGTLRPYQAEGYRWLRALADLGFGGILADEMGLGKSLQLIAFLLACRAEGASGGTSLVACPASLVYNWLAEFERFAPELRVRAVVGAKSERAAILEEGGCDVLVTSFDLLRIDVDDYCGKSYFCMAVDEAQYIKNHATLVARSVKRIDARHRFALTGTPIENRLSELWSIFDFLMPGFLGSYKRFRTRHEQPILGGDEEAAGRLQRIVGPFILRRLKHEVLADLPDKLETTVFAHLEGEQRKLYAAHEQKLRATLASQKDEDVAAGKIQILAELTKLRQLCCDPRLLYENYQGGAAKLDAVLELVDSVMDAGSKMLVFSQFTSFLELIAERLRASAVPFFTITGATPKKKRLELVNSFNADGTPVFLVSLKAGGTGLNLTGASVVVHADPWWNAAAQNQATDRAHRIGQTQVVSVYQLIAQGTIEERIVNLQKAKSDLADQIVDTGTVSAASLASLTKDDLLALLE